MIDNIKKIDIKDLPNVLLIFGEEEFLKDEALNYVIKSIIPNISTGYDFDTIKPDEVSLDKAIDICRAYPFVSEKRAVVIRNFDKYFSGKASKKSIEKTAIYKFLTSPQPSTFLVLTTDLDSLNGISKNLLSTKNQDKAFKAMKSAKFPFDIILDKHEWIEFPKVWENTFPAWIKNRIKAKGKNISDAAIEILLSHTNPTLRDISNELDKLLIYVLERKEINQDDAIAVVGTSRQFNVFELQKAVGAKDLYNSLNILQNMLAVDRAEMLILSILTRYFIALWKLAESGKVSEQNKYEIARTVGVSPFFLNDYVIALQRFGIYRIDRAFSIICETDEALKTSSTDSLYLMQKMLINIME